MQRNNNYLFSEFILFFSKRNEFLYEFFYIDHMTHCRNVQDCLTDRFCSHLKRAEYSTVYEGYKCIFLCRRSTFLSFFILFLSP